MKRWVRSALVVAAVLISAGLFWTPHDPMTQEFDGQRLAGISWEHPLGVDGLGRDVASRLWRGAAHTFLMAAAAGAACLVLATGLLVLERTLPWGTGRLIRGMTAMGIAIPALFMGLLLLVFLPPSPRTLIAAAALGTAPLAFRQLRVFWLEHSRAEYVRSSEVLGAGRWRIFTRSIWPNLQPDAAALFRIVFALAVLELSGLAFLGLIGDPDFPELGALLRENQRYFLQKPSLVMWPGIVLSGFLLLVHLSGGGREETSR